LEKIVKKCNENNKCKGFNTKGWLKSNVGDPAKIQEQSKTWRKWGSKPEDGIYIQTCDPNATDVTVVAVVAPVQPPPPPTNWMLFIFIAIFIVLVIAAGVYIFRKKSAIMSYH
jgi:hypothetical protein